MDLFNKKSCQTMAFMFNWAILLTAMGVRDLSNIIGHHAPTMESYASYFAEPFDPAFHQQELSLVEKEYTSNILFEVPGPSTASDVNIPTWSTAHIMPIDTFYTGAYAKTSHPSLHYPGESNSGVYHARDGLAVDIWSGAESQEPHLQEVGEEIRSHLSRPGSELPTHWLDAHLPNTPLTNTHTDIVGGYSWDQDQFASTSNHPQVTHIVNQRPGNVEDSPGRLEFLGKLPLISPEVRAQKPDREWKAVKGPSVAEHPPRISDIFEKESPEYAHDLHHQSVQDKSSEKLPSLARIPASGGYDYSALLRNSMYRFSTEHHVAFAPESYPARNLGENQNFESFMDSRIFQHEQPFKSRDASFLPLVFPTPHAFPITSPVSNQRNSLETLEALGVSSNHVDHDLNHLTNPMLSDSEKKQWSEWSSKLGSRDLTGIFNTPNQHSSPYRLSSAQEVSSDLGNRNRGKGFALQPGSYETHHVEDLSRLEGTSMNPHKESTMLLVPIPEQGDGSPKETSHGLLDSEGRASVESASGNARSDDSPGTRIYQWKNNEVELGQGESDEQNINQEKPSTTFQNTKSTFRDAQGIIPRGGQGERTTPIFQANSQSPKRKTQHDPSISDGNDGFITQAKKVSSSIDNEIVILSDSSTLSSPKRPRSHSKPRKTRGSDFGTEVESLTKIKRPRKRKIHPEKPLDLNEDHSKRTAIENYYGKAWGIEKSKKMELASLAHSEKRRETNTRNAFGQTMPTLYFPVEPFGFGSPNLAEPGKTATATIPHKPVSPRELVDKFWPRIQGFLKSISDYQTNELHAEYMKENMKKLWHNFLQMISMCSEVVSSNHIYTNMEEDLFEANSWIATRWARIPGTEFDWLPIKGFPYPAGKPKQRDSFLEDFEKEDIYEGTVFWLSHRMHDQRRERVAATYALRFMRGYRQHWIKTLTFSTSKDLVPKTLLISLKRVRPLKYPSSHS